MSKQEDLILDQFSCCDVGYIHVSEDADDLPKVTVKKKKRKIEQRNGKKCSEFINERHNTVLVYFLPSISLFVWMDRLRDSILGAFKYL